MNGRDRLLDEIHLLDEDLSLLDKGDGPALDGLLSSQLDGTLDYDRLTVETDAA